MKNSRDRTISILTIFQVMIALIPMAGTMTSFGGIKTAIQRPMNCTEYKATSDNTPVPLNVTSSPGKQGKAFAGTQVAAETGKKETQYECVGWFTRNNAWA